jgi:poly-beta-1,6-N-acetyl-D-glucosamine synthase
MLREILIYISTYIGLFAVTFYVLSYLSRAGEEIPEFNKENAPFVSIIVPAWNEEKGIERTIKSLLGLEYPKNKLEIIIVDDGSIDNTYKLALKHKSKFLKVFRLKKNSGKFAALNYGIEKSKGEIIVTTDADSLYLNKDALQKMVVYFFKSSRIMCVAPAMAIHQPRGILQRIQQVEYLLGVFLRKAFASVNAIHITPGAFSAYRKYFFQKYGGFKKGHLTEDMEMALRIQSKGFIIENSLDARVFTVAPNKFIPLLKQRRRWYTGLIKNFLDYRRLFSPKYGAMGLVVMPVAVITVILSVILTIYLTINTMLDIKKELSLLKSINFNILDSFQFNSFVVERFLFDIFSQPMFIFSFIFLGILLGYMVFAKRKIRENADIKISIFLFFFFYAFLFAFWWTLSFIYTLFFGKRVTWR